MPKVSDDYLVARRRHILDAARRSFTRNGFQATSMQDLFAESGLSAGAFYRYFDSKSAIIAAIAEESMGEVLAVLTTVVTDAHGGGIGEALARAMEVLAAKDDAEQAATLAIQTWGEALRDPVILARLRDLLDGTLSALADGIRRQQQFGNLPADIEAEALASVFFSLLPGFVVQRALLSPSAAVAASPAAVRELWPAGRTAMERPDGNRPGSGSF